MPPHTTDSRAIVKPCSKFHPPFAGFTMYRRYVPNRLSLLRTRCRPDRSLVGTPAMRLIVWSGDLVRRRGARIRVVAKSRVQRLSEDGSSGSLSPTGTRSPGRGTSDR